MVREVKMRKTEKTIWQGRFRGVSFEIVCWKEDNMEKPIWNYYIYIPRKKAPKVFKRFILKPIKYKITKTSPVRYRYDYCGSKFEEVFNMHGGITYWEYIRNGIGDIVGLKVGCDYDHLSDEGKTYALNEITADLKRSINSFLKWFPIFGETKKGDENVKIKESN